MEPVPPESSPARRRSSGAPATLRRRADFLRVAKGLRRHCGAFSVQTAAACASLAQVGYTVTKATGNAPQRNRIKRRLRAATRMIGPAMPDADFVIVARRGVLTMDFTQLTAAIASAMSHAASRLNPSKAAASTNRARGED